MKEGRLEFGLSGRSIRSLSRVDDGREHVAILEKFGSRLAMQLDTDSVSSEMRENGGRSKKKKRRCLEARPGHSRLNF